MNKLENNFLVVHTSSKGAELTRIYSKKLDKEILWDANPKYWGRHSPILFPIVGRLKNNQTSINSYTYNMTQHGFARDLEFSLINLNETSISYLLTSNEDTKSLYPYDFELTIKYILVDATVNVEWNLKNTNKDEMYFSIGAHPAFNLPLNEDESLNDYSLTLNSRGNVEQISLDGPYASAYTSTNDYKKINLSPELFANDALIYTNIDLIEINSKDSTPYLSVDFTNFPLVGIWSPYYKETNSTAPFLCIEPWYGLADSVDTDSIYKNKAYINNLASNKTFNARYSITVK